MKKENDILDVLFETENKENEEELPIPKKVLYLYDWYGM